jgi:hypothetical protein
MQMQVLERNAGMSAHCVHTIVDAEYYAKALGLNKVG